jgi:hypothetical protein
MGMAVHMTGAEVASMRANPMVAYVEPDAQVRAAGIELSAPWGLDRIDQRALPLSGSYSWTGDGTGVSIYIIDSGINFTNVEFGGRAVTGIDIVTSGGTAADCFGHGTHVAGIAGGTQYGVAKQARLVSVRVLGCSGSGATSDVLAGIDWVVTHHSGPSVVNLSLTFGAAASLNAAVANAANAGVVVTLAAGNASADACPVTPAPVAGALTVASSSITDDFSPSSNFGSCVGLVAPGDNIPAAGNGSPTAVVLGGGTSSAAPHVAGAAATWWQLHPTATPAQVTAALVANATVGAVRNVPAGTPNRLLNTTFGGTPPPVNAAPVARFTLTCPTLHCSADASASTDDHGIVSYAWVWGNGKFKTTPTAFTSTTYYANAVYTVSLTVTDASGLQNTLTKSVTIPVGAVNQAPTASISAPTAGASVVAGSSVTFAGSGTDAEDGVLAGSALTWTSSRDGAIGTGATFSRSTLSVGVHTITLTATDSKLAVGTASRTLTVTVTPPVNQSPVASISAPAAGASVVAGSAVTFAGSGTDPEDGTLAGSALAWTSSRDGAIGTGTSFSRSTLSVGTHTITLTATDSKLAVGTASRTLTVTAAPPVNQAPVARFTWVCGVASARNCRFDASTSTDDAGIVSYGWVWGNGKFKTVPTAITTTTFYVTGPTTVTLTVTDAQGRTGTITQQVPIP